jgi:hypothetical protein
MHRESACVEFLVIGLVDSFVCSFIVEFLLTLVTFPRGGFPSIRRDRFQPLRRLTVVEVRREIWGVGFSGESSVVVTPRSAIYIDMWGNDITASGHPPSSMYISPNIGTLQPSRVCI